MSRSPARILVATATVLLLVLALAGTADASPSGRTTTIIRAVGAAYSSPHWSPNRVKVSPGSKIEWLAVTYDHHIVAYGGHWHFDHALPNGSSVTHRFAKKGTYLFRCTIHSTIVNGVCQGMCGKVVVH
ncbi:MAG: cupredoxin domain-containing protein [Actinomycetota bacterium]